MPDAGRRCTRYFRGRGALGFLRWSGYFVAASEDVVEAYAARLGLRDFVCEPLELELDDDDL